MNTIRRVAVVGSRKFANYNQLKTKLDEILELDDEIVSGGAVGVDSFAQRYCKEHGITIHIYYPDWERKGRGAGFIRNRHIVEHSDLVLAFYAKGSFQEGGTANTAMHARQLGVELKEYEEK